jgi:ArsR family transcriptional regulator
MISPALTPEVTRLHADICSGLAEPSRILILYILSENPRNVSQVAREIGISQPACSRHLLKLRERGIVLSTRDGQSVVYRLSDPRIIKALDLLRDVLADQLKNQAQLAENAFE